MPGNEVGGRVHNFFDQGNLSQDQRHTQFVAANWPGYNTNIWNASERQIGRPVSTGSEHYNSQQSDIERGQGNHFAFGPNGLNLARPNLRPEFVKSPSQFPQFHLNGFMHTSQIGHTRQNEANFLGVDTEPDQCNVTSRNSILESPQRSGSVLADSASFGGSESPMNFNFFGGQHQMNGQQAGMMQPLPQQQPGNNDSQMQQQFILKQMELQRQHQLQQFEAIKRSAGGQISHFPNETAGQQLNQINGNQLRDTSNCLWPSQVHTASNTNWQQRGLSSSVPGFAKGFMISPEQGQSMHFMGLNPQQTSHSLYGVPVSSSHRSNAFSHGNNDNSGTLQVPGPSSSFSGNQYGTLEGQVAMKEGNMVSRYGSEGKSSFQRASSQQLGNMVNLGGFTQAQQRNVPISEGSGQGFASGIELAAEKPVTQDSSQGTVGLDPTEEKILFGSDDNIWEAFGGASLTGSGDATDHLNSLSSMQSGTWSALMQSAVAETSSTDGGVHEEWSGLGSQNSRVQSGSQHHLVFNSKEKSQDNMVDSFQRASLGSQRSGNDLNIYNANANSNVNYANSSGRQHQSANQERDYLQKESETTQVGRRWLDYQQQKPHVEEKRVVENSNSSRDFSSTDSGLWGHQPSTLLSNNNSYQSGQPSPSNYIGSAPANGSIASSNQHNLFGKDREVQVGMDRSRSAVMRLEPVPNSNIKMGKDNAGAPSFNNVKIDHKSIRNLPDNHQLDLLMSVNSSGKFGSEGVGSDHHNLNKGPPMSGSLNNSPDDGAAEIHETENMDRRDNSIGSPGSNFRRNASVGNFREDFHSLPRGKEKSSSQVGKRGPITQNFQYHPMGDVDVNLDSSHGAKQNLDSQSLSQNLLGVQGQEANPRFLGPSSTNITDKEGNLFDYHGAINVSRGASPNQHMSPSQNMLELLHKVDQSKEQNAASHFRSSEYNRLSNASGGGVAGPSQSQLSSSHAFSLQLAPPSQGIGRPKTPNLGDSVQRSSRSASSPGTDYVASEIGDKTHSWLASSVSSAQCLPSSHKPTQMDSGIEPGRLGNMDVNLKDSSSVSDISTPQSEHSTAPGGKIIGDQASVAFGRQGYQNQQLNDSQSQVTSHLVTNSHVNSVAERDMNHPGVHALVHKMPAPFYPVMAGMSRKDNLSHLGNLWASQQHLLGSQGSNVSELFKPQFQSPNASETSFAQQMRDKQDGPKRLDPVSYQRSVGGEETQTAEARSSMKVAGTNQEAPSKRHQHLEAYPSCSAINQKDSEPFQHLANQSNAAHNNYSLLHQMQTIKNLGSDPSHRESKRLKGEDDGLTQITGQVVAPVTSSMDSMARDLTMSQTSVSAGDAKMLNFSPQLGNQNDFQLPHGAITSNDMVSYGRGEPQIFAAGNVNCRIDHVGISPQMAPSWFERYGTFKSRQFLPVQDATRVSMNNVEQQVISGNPPNNLAEQNSVQLAAAATEAGQVVNTCRIANAYTASSHLSSLHSLVPHVSTPKPASLTPKKRKTATTDLLSWNKEIGMCLRRLQNLNSAEEGWAQSSNRLVEKFEGETGEDLLSMTRPRNRLLVTTQLMQQVFQPPSAAVLSLDASSNYEVIVYSLARSVLGDACSLTCGMESNSPFESANLLSGQVKTSEKIRDQYFSKVVEDFASREKELKNELLRLDKRASVLDFRVECQDLERFSVINRFARFHGRGQVDGAETSSSSDANATVYKPCPQKFVSAHPMPRNVPERVQCLSL